MRFRSEGTTVLARRIGYALVALLALALIWYGAMTALLAFGVDRDTVDGVSGYRAVYDELASLESGDVDGGERGVIAGIGVACFLLFGYLAWRCLPRAEIGRDDIEVVAAGPGATKVRARAVERVAEVAARADASVRAASGHYDGRTLAVDVHVADSRALPATLDGARRRVAEAVREHGLPEREITVTLTGLDQTTGKRAQ